MANEEYRFAHETLNRAIQNADQTYSFPPAALGEIRASIKKMTDMEDVRAAARDLVNAAWFLDVKLKSPLASADLLKVVSEVVPSLRAHEVSRSEENTEAVSKKFASYTAQQPKSGGEVKLDGEQSTVSAKDFLKNVKP